MDPVSLTASIVAFIGFIGKVSKIASTALQYAETALDTERDCAHAAGSISSALAILRRLCEIENMISKIPDHDLQAFNLPEDDQEALLAATEDLSACLQAKQARRRGWIGRLRALWSDLLQPGSGDPILQRHLQRFNDKMLCLSMALGIIQAYGTLAIRELSAQNRVALAEHSAETKAHFEGLQFGQKISLKSVAEVHKIGQSTLASVNTLHKRIDASNVAHADGFQNIMEAIDTRISAITSPPDLHSGLSDTCFSVPYPRNRCFAGRDDLLCQIAEFLCPSPEEAQVPGAHVYGINGLPGVGKTHVAIEFAYRHKSSFSHIFWISADSEEKLEQGYVNIARFLGLTNAKVVEDKDKSIMLAKSWLAKPHERARWLLIFDNVDDFRVLNHLWTDFDRGSVMITSREAHAALTAVSPSSKVNCLMPFSLEEGQDMLKARLRGRIPGDLDDPAAEGLARRLACFPLYMDQVTSLIESSSLSLSEFYEMNPEIADHELQQCYVGGPWYQASVARAMEDQITRLDKQARDILSIIAFFDPDAIPERLLICQDGKIPILSTSLRCQTTLLTLTKFSLLHRHTGGQDGDRCLNIHRLVRDATMRLNTTPQKAFDNAVHLLRQSFPLHGMARDHMVEDWEDCEKFQPHVLAFYLQYQSLRSKGLIQSSLECLEILYSCAWYMCERGRFELGKQLIKTVHDDYMAMFSSVCMKGPQSVFLADIYTAQLFYHIETIHGGSSVDLAYKALKIREAAVEAGHLDSNHPNRANSFMNAGVALVQKDPRMAVEMHSRALEIRLGSDRYTSSQIHGLALNHLNIGRSWWLVNEVDKSAECFEKCLSLMTAREAEVGKTFVLSAWAMCALGVVRMEQGDLESAIDLLSRSMELHEQTLGKTHMKTLACYYQVACVCHRIKELLRSKEILLQLIQVYESMPAPPIAEIARSKYKLSQILEEAESSDDSWLEIRNDAIETLRKIPGREELTSPTEFDFDNQIAYFLR